MTEYKIIQLSLYLFYFTPLCNMMGLFIYKDYFQFIPNSVQIPKNKP